MTWVETFTGGRVDLLSTREADIHLVDIGYHLAGINRYTGAVGRYTVAQHCCVVASLVPLEFRPHALFHDAPEYLAGDVSAPLKLAMREFAKGRSHWDMVHDRIAEVIYSRFGIEWTTVALAAVRDADMRALAWEKRDVAKSHRHDWTEEVMRIVPPTTRLRRWGRKKSFRNWLKEAGTALNGGDHRCVPR